MGSSTSGYSSYDGKGSTSKRRETVDYVERATSRTYTSPMAKMLELLDKVEKARENVDAKKRNESQIRRKLNEAEREVRKAQRDLEDAERAVELQIDNLDPQTRERLRAMLNRHDRKNQGQDYEIL